MTVKVEDAPVNGGQSGRHDANLIRELSEFWCAAGSFIVS
jgi:hypothetical protein